MQETGKNTIYNDEQIKNFAGFYNAIRKVHRRLTSEGYIIKDGHILSPAQSKPP